MKKKIIAMLIVLVMAVSIFPMSAFAAPAKVTTATIRDKAVNGYYNLLIYNVEYKIPSGTVLYNDGGVTWRSTTRTAQLKLTEFSVDYNKSSINPGSTDGYFGSKTEAATEAFQEYWNDYLAYWYAAGTVDVDGIIGGQTWSAFCYYVHLY